MTTGDVQREARALGDPTRHRLFRYIVEADRPVSVSELTDFVRLNHNAVRQHLAVLKDTGLIVEQVEDRDRPGRPRLLYRIHPEAAGSWGTSGAYAWLARLLADAVRRGLEPRQAGRESGQEEAAGFDRGSDPADVLEEEMTRRGFRPARVERGRRLEFVFGRCPFEEVASGDPETVCQLHLGLAEGMAEGLGGLEVDRLVAEDSRRAGCRLVVRKDAAPSSA